jgi:phenylpyruvate tautomerase PptA (4-oxalocrotonate tautomerase family)
MPLFTVTMKAGRGPEEIEGLSNAIHAASVAAGYLADDQFQRFVEHQPSHLKVDPRYPGLPKARTDRVLIIEVLVSSGTDVERKRLLVERLVEKIAIAGTDPNDIMVFFLETDRASGSFGGGQFAPLVAFS